MFLHRLNCIYKKNFDLMFPIYHKSSTLTLLKWPRPISKSYAFNGFSNLSSFCIKKHKHDYFLFIYTMFKYFLFSLIYQFFDSYIPVFFLILFKCLIFYRCLLKTGSDTKEIPVNKNMLMTLIATLILGISRGTL